MSKFSVLFLFVLVAIPMIAQTDMPYTINTGNSYIVGNDVMNRRAYEGYLQNTCPEAFHKFHDGRVISNVGWGMLGGGLALEIGAVIGTIAVLLSPKYKSLTDKSQATITTLSCYYSGIGVVVAGISCVCVGYVQMHQAVDIYNVKTSNTQPEAFLKLQAGQDGIGLALCF